jgi:predicted nucleic acid-binding protein
MKPRVFLDTNIFIYGFELPDSNSAEIIKLLNQAEIEAVISEKVIEEVMEYFKKHHDKDLAAMYRIYLLQSCSVVRSTQLEDEMGNWSKQIKEKDLEQLTAVKTLGIKYLVSYDRDFKPFQEYYTPREFLQQTGESVSETEY